MKITQTTPDVFVTGARTLGCAIPAITMAMGIIWGMMAILTLDKGIPNKIFAMVFFGIFVVLFLAMRLPSVYRNQLVLNRPGGVAELRLAA
ncbi:hypothetical protein L0664_08215 [Octadecabacter sp. G9-8]|uniref:Type IV secretion system protein VirB3 n=1 Tax=Octadecabacter dasysiphoniae TaxID=2909341 RepID=A0ABS9CV57_9RHOB|nr:hypothetical protein [Octadecabacter dasysiphoniae]MCF2871048.1 hypothetical protein [Octadecabacter dasysiphoniae]